MVTYCGICHSTEMVFGLTSLYFFTINYKMWKLKIHKFTSFSFYLFALLLMIILHHDTVKLMRDIPKNGSERDWREVFYAPNRYATLPLIYPPEKQTTSTENKSFYVSYISSRPLFLLVRVTCSFHYHQGFGYCLYSNINRFILESHCSFCDDDGNAKEKVIWKSTFAELLAIIPSSLNSTMFVKYATTGPQRAAF